MPSYTCSCHNRKTEEHRGKPSIWHPKQRDGRLSFPAGRPSGTEGQNKLSHKLDKANEGACIEQGRGDCEETTSAGRAPATNGEARKQLKNKRTGRQARSRKT